MVSFTLRQVTSIVDGAAGPTYRVVNQVTETLGAGPGVFVYAVATKAFSHYATAGDVELWPDSLEEAQVRNLAFYRLDSVSRVWASISEMNEDLDTTSRRVQMLANELTARRQAIVIDRSTVIQGS